MIADSWLRERGLPLMAVPDYFAREALLDLSLITAKFRSSANSSVSRKLPICYSYGCSLPADAASPYWYIYATGDWVSAVRRWSEASTTADVCGVPTRPFA